MKRRLSAHSRKAVHRMEVPLPSVVSAEQLLASKLGSSQAARSAIQMEQEGPGLALPSTRPVSAALALTRSGADLDLVAKSLAWDEFEDYCALAMSAAGYGVRRNVHLRKPRRQIDIIAESGSLVLAVDCKHWRRGSGPASLVAQVQAQAERTRMYAKGAGAPPGTRFLPVLVTMLDNQIRSVDGMPVVPIQALREFLSAVSRFDERLSFIEVG
jgi:hypothetical protein